MKSAKKAPRQRPATPAGEKSSVEHVLDRSITILMDGLDAISHEIGQIRSGVSESDRHDPASRIAFLTAKVGSIADSVRKVEAARSRRVEKLTKAIVMAWFRQLDPSERASMMREVRRLDDEGSVLG